jgi:hypothetical protein
MTIVLMRWSDTGFEAPIAEETSIAEEHSDWQLEAIGGKD